jgi:2-polyprenyl-6-methoxyphenol hydroxylase-like FAD-dependent oxidoreductase
METVYDKRSLLELSVVVSGAGVAGPALAYWLARFGARVTVVEAARAPQTGGFAVDFRGPTHLGVLERMGVLDDLRRLQTHGGGIRRVDERGRVLWALPAEFAGGDVEVRRRDLSSLLRRRSAESADYVFGDAVTTLHEDEGGVNVELARGGTLRADLVVGADGMHSGVRRLVFGPERRFVTQLGYFLAGWDLPNDLGADAAATLYNVPGRMASISADDREPGRARVMMVFAAAGRDGEWWRDDAWQRRVLTDAFRGMAWHVPRLLAGLAEAEDLYFDAIARVRVPDWHRGRVALLGDAAWGVTLGGMGVGTGVVGAYVLAGELAAAGGDHRAAFPRYERRMRGYAAAWQRGASPGRFLAPRTRPGLWLRDTLFTSAVVRRLMVSATHSLATTDALPAYAEAC